MNKKNKAIIYMLISALAFSFMGAFVKLSGDLPTFQKTFFRNLVASIISAMVIIKNKESFIGKKENRKILIIRSTFGTLGMLCYFYSIDKLLLSDSSMLNKLNPFFVSIFAFFVLKETLSRIQIPALIMAFSGAVLIIKPEFNMSVIPALIGLIGAVFAAGAYTAVRFLGGKEKFYTIVFFFSAFSCLATLPFMIYYYKEMNIQQMMYLVATGVFAAIGQFALTIAYKYAPAGEISILNYTNVLFSGVLGYFIYAQVPDFLSVIGYFLIILAAFMIYYYNNYKTKMSKEVRANVKG